MNVQVFVPLGSDDMSAKVRDLDMARPFPNTGFRTMCTSVSFDGIQGPRLSTPFMMGHSSFAKLGARDTVDSIGPRRLTVQFCRVQNRQFSLNSDSIRQLQCRGMTRHRSYGN